MSAIASHPVLTCAEAKELEARLLRDPESEWQAMQRAGAEAACAIIGDFREIGGLPHSPRILVLAGKGHNGGDALLAAAGLLRANPPARVDVLLAFPESTLRPLAARALAGLRNEHGARVVDITLPDAKTAMATYDVCIDGVFGFQLRPPLEDATAELLAWVNTHPRIRLRAAVDLPSGLGEENAGTIFRADFTYATGIVKRPVIDPANGAIVGRIRYLDLGFFDRSQNTDNSAPHDFVLLAKIIEPLAGLRPSQTDKRSYGHLFVIGGSLGFPGAILMTVQAALRSGAGLVTAFVPADLVAEYAAKLPEAMWVGWPQSATGSLTSAINLLLAQRIEKASAVVIGPGLGAEPETLAVVADLVSNIAQPIVLDADAIRSEILRAAAGKQVIITPHAGELQRVAGVLASTGKAGKLDDPVLADAVAAEVVVVAKGPLTRISRPANSGRSYHSLFGGPVLARGGSGDILAGLIGGLLAQDPHDLLLAAARGVVWHGLAADFLARDRGQVAVQTTQLFEYLQPALTYAANDIP